MYFPILSYLQNTAIFIYTNKDYTRKPYIRNTNLKYYFMKKIKIPRGEGWKRLESLIRYQLDNFSDFELKELTRISIDVKNSNLTEDEKVEKNRTNGRNS